MLGGEPCGLIEKLQGARLIADFEAGCDRSDPAARQRLFEMSERYGLTSSEMSLVAVVERADDQPGSVPKTKVVPVGMPQDTNFSSYFASRVACRLPRSTPLYSKSRATGLQALFAAGHPPIAERRARFLLARRTQDDLAPLIREVARIIEEYVFSGRTNDGQRYIKTLRGILNSVRSRATTQAHQRALKRLIDYLTSGSDPAKWSAVKAQLDACWPSRGAAVWPATEGHGAAGSLTAGGIRAGMRREEALRTFEGSVNQPGTMFSTNQWLAPKLRQLQTLLGDPITEEQATALLDVLHERHWMRDLIEWLQGPPMFWQSFFVLREFVGAKIQARDARQVERWRQLL